MSSAKVSENNLLKFQLIRLCQNDVITVLSVADAVYRQQDDAAYRQQQVTAW